MFQRLKRMWDAFLQGIALAKKAFKGEKIDVYSQEYQDIKNINWLAIAVAKIANLSCTEATFAVESESALTEPLKDLCKDIESRRFDIVEGMLGGGDFYVVPATNSRGDLYHSYLDSSRVRIVDEDSRGIAKAYMVIDYYQPDKSERTFYLQRIHELDDNGNLTISYAVVDGNGQPKSVDYWEDIKDTVTQFVGANHIGLGRYKSPVSSRGLSTVYGVPLNFGCSQIEKDIFETLKQINDEFRNGKSVIFTDPRNLRLDKDENGNVTRITGMDNVIPLKRNAGDNGVNVDIFNPNLRGSEHYEKLQNQLAMYEQQMGLSKGVFTENEAMATGTATAVRRSNSDTISFINAVHNALDAGNRMTLEADSIFLNVRADLWEYISDYYDPFADSVEQFNMLLQAHDKGAITTERITKWIFPNWTEEQVADELANIGQAQTNATNDALARVLNM